MTTAQAWLKRRGVALGSVAVAAMLYRLLLRRPILNWGATDAEANARLPGDELLENADGVATRAITIDAPAAAVWPWIAQIGPSPRGGAYTYDWIENLLGLDMHSADRVLPDYQDPQVGDTLGYGKNRMRFERVEPQRVLATRSEDGNWVWTFVLDEQDGRNRLISRNRFRLPTLTAKIGMVPMEPASLVMERKMLRGIKRRAESLAEERRRHVSETNKSFAADEARVRVRRAREEMVALARPPGGSGQAPSPSSRRGVVARSRTPPRLAGELSRPGTETGAGADRPGEGLDQHHHGSECE